MKKFIFTCLIALSAFIANGQIYIPVKWEFSMENDWLIFTAHIEEGWHLYGMGLPEDGPVSTSFTFEKITGASLEGSVIPKSKEVEQYDEQFAMKLRWYVHEAVFKQRIKVTDAANLSIGGEIVYMACNDQTCLPPTRETFSFGKAPTIQKENTESPSSVNPGSLLNNSTAQQNLSGNDQEWWAPVIQELKALGDKGLTVTEGSFWLIFITGFLGGLIALVTPCVWPMIPMTVSFFLKRKQSKKSGRVQAFIYGIAIIVIYLLLGLLVTGIFGASALNDLSTNAFFNLLFFALLVVFAISFFGAFDLTLPASWSNKLDQKADSTTGLLSIFFMAFTLVLVSFSCTGPIIGTLLVQAATSGNLIAPAIGMFGFALALSLPFTLFAIFPAWLHSMPKSGGWLNSIKVVLGFLELALAFKFLSVADLAYGWGILDREVFLVLWIAIFFLLGMYLLGKIKLPHDSDMTKVSPFRLLLAIISLSFSLYMVPGLWGAPLKAISAFTPPLSTQHFNLYPDEVHAQFNDYDEGMAFALKAKKPVLVDFSGYGCVNCRKMEASVWTVPAVKNLIENDFVLITLFVDDKRSLPETVEVEENGKLIKLKTYGDKWSYLERSKFGANAQPFYVILDNEGFPLAPSFAFSEDANAFIQFLQQGKERYKTITKK
ncbi:MAG: cytochrome c biogenesis protein CcdA [Bacteroidales bacterium]|nr:cytochrome c biogenesis protein CcdA [Bacteroidales bacterium]